MTEYEMNWQAEASNEKLERLKAELSAYWSYLDDPMMRSFHITKPLRDEFKDRFGDYI
jgi:hypothetical protein